MKFFHIVSLLREDAAQDSINRTAKMFPKVDRALIDQLAREADISDKKIYLRWIVGQVSKGNLRMPEDIQKTAEALRDFEKARKLRVLSGPDSDIMRYPTYSALHQKLTQVRGESQEVEIKADRHQSGQETVFDKQVGNNAWKVIKITNNDTAEKLLKGSGWCVQHKDTAKAYLEEGPLYLVLKDGKRYALAHSPSGSLKGIHDKSLSIEIDEAEELYGILKGLGDISFDQPGEIQELQTLANASKSKEYGDLKRLLAKYTGKPWAVIKVDNMAMAKIMTIGSPWEVSNIPVYFILRNGRRTAMADEKTGSIKGFNGEPLDLEDDAPKGDYANRFGSSRELHNELVKAGLTNFDQKDMRTLSMKAMLAEPNGKSLWIAKHAIIRLINALINTFDSMLQGYGLRHVSNHEMPDSEVVDYLDPLYDQRDEEASKKSSNLFDTMAKDFDNLSGLKNMSKSQILELFRLMTLGAQDVATQIDRRKYPLVFPTHPTKGQFPYWIHDRWDKSRDEKLSAAKSTEQDLVAAMKNYQRIARSLNSKLADVVGHSSQDVSK